MTAREKLYEAKKVNQRRNNGRGQQSSDRLSRRPISESIPPRLVDRGRFRLAHLGCDDNLPLAERQEMGDADHDYSFAFRGDEND
jgi:hypothetical protein